MSLFQRISNLIIPDNDMVGIEDNLQEARDDSAQKGKRLGPDIEITAIEVGDTDEKKGEHTWFTLRRKRE